MLSGWSLDPAGNGGTRGMIMPCSPSGAQGTEPGLCPAPGPFYFSPVVIWNHAENMCHCARCGKRDQDGKRQTQAVPAPERQTDTGSHIERALKPAVDIEHFPGRSRR